MTSICTHRSIKTLIMSTVYEALASWYGIGWRFCDKISCTLKCRTTAPAQAWTNGLGICVPNSRACFNDDRRIYCGKKWNRLHRETSRIYMSISYSSLSNPQYNLKSINAQSLVPYVIIFDKASSHRWPPMIPRDTKFGYLIASKFVRTTHSNACKGSVLSRKFKATIHWVY